MHAKFCSLAVRALCLSGKDWGFTGIGAELVSDNLQWQILNILCLYAHMKNYEHQKRFHYANCEKSHLFISI